MTWIRLFAWSRLYHGIHHSIIQVLFSPHWLLFTYNWFTESRCLDDRVQYTGQAVLSLLPPRPILGTCILSHLNSIFFVSLLVWSVASQSEPTILFKQTMSLHRLSHYATYFALIVAQSQEFLTRNPRVLGLICVGFLGSIFDSHRCLMTSGRPTVL